MTSLRTSSLTPRSGPAAALSLGVVALMVTLAACSGSGGGAASTNAAAPHAQAGEAFAGVGVSGAGKAPDSAAASLTQVNLSTYGRSQIKTASLVLRSTTVGQAVTRIEDVATTQGGFVASEDTSSDRHGIASSSSITVRVPVADFDVAVTDVSRIGQVASKKVTTQDVTGRVADVASRVTSARDAIAQLRILFNRATRLGDVITLESELSQRQADLEALQAQQRALADQTNLATISVLVTRPPAVGTPKPHPISSAGFLGGLKEGWGALVTTFAAVAHGVGAILPLGIVLAVLGWLVWMPARRIQALRRPPASSSDTSG